jgi:molecular chaperone GrpE
MSAVLADFRDWLTALADHAPPEVSVGGGAAVDLHTLLGQFLAVRHEVNLQTRAVRAQQEQNVEALRQLSAALDALRQAQARGQDSEDKVREEAVRPLLKTLIDLHDALSLGGREVRRMQEAVQPALEQLTAATAPATEASPEPPAPPAASRSLWERWFGPPIPNPALRVDEERQKAQQERARVVRESSERIGAMLTSLVTGYTMSLQRVERALRQHGLEAIPTTGQRFDPEQMEVVEAVVGSGRPSGEVIEEVRRGYLWEGRVLRYAQVRVARS